MALRAYYYRRHRLWACKTNSIMPIIDIFDRCIVDYHIGLSCETRDAAIILKRALLKRQLCVAKQKQVIRSDNEQQFISNLFKGTCLELNIEHERTPFKTTNLNTHIEAFHAILEEECLSRYEFASSLLLNHQRLK